MPKCATHSGKASRNLARKPRGVGVARGAGVHEAGLARQDTDLGQEAAGAELDDRDDMAETAPGADGEGAGDEHEHAGVDLAGRDERIAGRIPANRPESPESVDIFQADPGKQLVKAGVRGGHREVRRPFGPRTASQWVPRHCS
jgi:hypothetical protein